MTPVRRGGRRFGRRLASGTVPVGSGEWRCTVPPDEDLLVYASGGPYSGVRLRVGALAPGETRTEVIDFTSCGRLAFSFHPDDEARYGLVGRTVILRTRAAFGDPWPTRRTVDSDGRLLVGDAVGTTVRLALLCAGGEIELRDSDGCQRWTLESPGECRRIEVRPVIAPYRVRFAVGEEPHERFGLAGRADDQTVPVRDQGVPLAYWDAHRASAWLFVRCDDRPVWRLRRSELLVDAREEVLILPRRLAGGTVVIAWSGACAEHRALDPPDTVSWRMTPEGSDDQTVCDGRLRGGDDVRVDDVAPGTYRVQAHAGARTFTSDVIRVEPGDTVRVVVRLEASRLVVVSNWVDVPEAVRSGLRARLPDRPFSRVRAGRFEVGIGGGAPLAASIVGPGLPRDEGVSIVWDDRGVGSCVLPIERLAEIAVPVPPPLMGGDVRIEARARRSLWGSHVFGTMRDGAMAYLVPADVDTLVICRERVGDRDVLRGAIALRPGRPDPTCAFPVDTMSVPGALHAFEVVEWVPDVASDVATGFPVWRPGDPIERVIVPRGGTLRGRMRDGVVPLARDACGRIVLVAAERK